MVKNGQKIGHISLVNKITHPPSAKSREKPKVLNSQAPVPGGFTPKTSTSTKSATIRSQLKNPIAKNSEEQKKHSTPKKSDAPIDLSLMEMNKSH